MATNNDNDNPNPHGIVYADSQQAHPDGGYSGSNEQQQQQPSLSREPSYVNEDSIQAPPEKGGGHHDLNDLTPQVHPIRGSTQEYGPDGRLLNNGVGGDGSVQDRAAAAEGLSSRGHGAAPGAAETAVAAVGIPRAQGEQEYPGREYAKVAPDHSEFERGTMASRLLPAASSHPEPDSSNPPPATTAPLHHQEDGPVQSQGALDSGYPHEKSIGGGDGDGGLTNHQQGQLHEELSTPMNHNNVTTPIGLPLPGQQQEYRDNYANDNNNNNRGLDGQAPSVITQDHHQPQQQHQQHPAYPGGVGMEGQQSHQSIQGEGMMGERDSKPKVGFAGVGAMGYPHDEREQQQLMDGQGYPGQYDEQQQQHQHHPEGLVVGNQYNRAPGQQPMMDGQQPQQYLMEDGTPGQQRPMSYGGEEDPNAQQTQHSIDPTTGAVALGAGGAALGAGAAGLAAAGVAASQRQPSMNGTERPGTALGDSHGPNTGVRPLSSATVGGFNAERPITGGGLGAALATSGHDLTKEDKKALKSEIKTEKKFEKQLKSEAQKEGEEIAAAIKVSKLSLKNAEKAAKHESSFRSTHQKAIKKELRAKKALLKVTAEYNKVAAELEAATKEMEVRKNLHIAAKEAMDADKQKVNDLRTLKGQHDMEREARHGESLTKQNQAKRALSMSKRKSVI